MPVFGEKVFFYKEKDSANKIRLKTYSKCQTMRTTCKIDFVAHFSFELHLSSKIQCLKGDSVSQMVISQ